jgi:hypothetical protein
MNSRQIDLLNIGLIILSFLLACIIPFKLFVFSYAVLGPLHYITEINWLKKKSYFLEQPTSIRFFVGVALLVSLPVLLKTPLFSEFVEMPIVYQSANFVSKYSNLLILTSLVAALGLVVYKRFSQIYGLMSLVLIVLFLALKFIPGQILVLAAFIPTLIHVYIFTMLFMLFGALKSSEKTAYATIFLLALVPVFILILPIQQDTFWLDNQTRGMFSTLGFDGFSTKITKLFSSSDRPDQLAVFGLKIQIFISFAYTYHYLNWFSKTSIIGWNRNNSLLGNALIVVAWIGSVSLYFLENKLGLALLFTLSLLHVLMEFPLNARSIQVVSQSLSRTFRTKSSPK